MAVDGPLVFGSVQVKHPRNGGINAAPHCNQNVVAEFALPSSAVHGRLHTPLHHQDSSIGIRLCMSAVINLLM